MNLTEFKKVVNRHFAPKARELGWTGNGFNYLKIEKNHLVKIFGMHGSWMGGCVYCETGIHFDFLPLYENDSPIEKKKVTECFFRERLSVGTWEFFEDEERNIKQVEGILNEFLTKGSNFYTDFEKFPNPFDKISVKDIADEPEYKLLDKYEITNDRTFALLLKDINLHLGRVEIAKEFSEYGITRTEEFAKQVLVGRRKSKTYRIMEESIKMEIDNLKIR